jgi:hypothetical protein
MSAASSRTFLQNQPLRSVSTIIDTLCRGSLAGQTVVSLDDDDHA